MLVIEGHPNILSDFNNNSNTDTHVHTCKGDGREVPN